MDKKSKVLELARQGVNNAEISRQTGVPRATVSRWVLDVELRHGSTWDVVLSGDWLRKPIIGG